MDRTIKGSIPNFPSLDEIKRGIEKISAIDLRKITENKDFEKLQKELNEFFMNHLKFMAFPFLQMESSKIFDKVYRIRKHDNSIDTSQISEYSYPPANCIKNFSRANLPYHPVFYCSPDAKTSIIETIRPDTNLTEDNIYLLSEWNFRPNYIFNITPFILGNTSDSNPFKPLSDLFKNKLIEASDKLSDEQIEVVLETIKLFSSLFVKNDNYALTSYIANKYLYANHSFRSDIFIYPSIQTEKHTVNYAISPNTVLEKMQLSRVFSIRMNELQKTDELHFQFSCELIQCAICQNGMLYWQNPNDELNEYFKNIFPTN
jgi:hypothetical protein